MFLYNDVIRKDNEFELKVFIYIFIFQKKISFVLQVNFFIKLNNVVVVFIYRYRLSYM